MGNETFNKRQKERARQDAQRAKAVEREARRREKALRPAASGDEDPDIAHIVPGPQPPLED